MASRVPGYDASIFPNGNVQTVRSYVDDATYAARNLLDEVLMQRRIELWGEGFRLFDLTRQKIAIDRQFPETNFLSILGEENGKKRPIHILVATAFVEKPSDDGTLYVNHIDGDKNHYFDDITNKRKKVGLGCATIVILAIVMTFIFRAFGSKHGILTWSSAEFWIFVFVILGIWGLQKYFSYANMKEHRDEMDKIFKSKNDSQALEIWKKYWTHYIQRQRKLKSKKTILQQLFKLIQVGKALLLSRERKNFRQLCKNHLKNGESFSIQHSVRLWKKTLMDLREY
jgi:hypothetical protein